MKTITFDCETTTPMFLGGADGQTPELRPPSIKGLMRFWWRAMNEHLSIKDFKDLKYEEAKIFGASDEKIGRSRFNIRTLNNHLETQAYHPVPRKHFTLRAIRPNQKISIILSSHYNAIDKYSDVLKASIILGGFGKRARRGFGSIKILKVDNQSYDFDYYNLKTILKLVNSIGDNNYVIADSGDRIVLKDTLTAPYPFLKEIQLGKECNYWEELMEKIGEAAHKHNVDSLGFAKDRKRLASPIYVSILRNSNNKHLPIISTLNTVFEDGRKIDYNEQNRFKGAIL